MATYFLSHVVMTAMFVEREEVGLRSSSGSRAAGPGEVVGGDLPFFLPSLPVFLYLIQSMQRWVRKIRSEERGENGKSTDGEG